MANRDLQTVIYTDDQGHQYRMKIDKFVFQQQTALGVPLVGGSDYTGASLLAPMPTNLRPRHVVVTNAGNKRRVICLSKNAPLYDTNHAEYANQVNLQVLGAAPTAYTTHRINGESYKRAGSKDD